MQSLELDKIQQIADLFTRRLHHELSETDRQTLEDWLQEQSPEHRRRLEDMTDREQIRSALEYLYRVDTPSALADAQKKILADESRILPLPEGKIRRKISLFKYTAAAVTAAAVIGTAVVLLLPKKKTDHPIARSFLNDVAPGGNKAILQLTDGSHIVLDSAMNGELVHQGAFKVMKLADGQLAYQPVDPSATGSPEAYNTIFTPRGGQYAVILPDGTKVWLNAASSLRFPTHFTAAERRVTLSGEAYFEVAKNDKAPFTVEAGGMQVAVLGTQFDIETYTDEKEQKTTLLQGAVKVTAGLRQTLLQPGQQARLANEGASLLQVVTAKKASDAIAWKNGLFLFREDSIQSVMRQVARWYDVDVVYQGKIDQDFFGKIPRNVPISTLLKILESTGSVHFTVEGKKITVAP